MTPFFKTANNAVNFGKPLVHQISRALKPSGRFVAEMGGKGNIDTIEIATRAALQKRGLLGKISDPNYYPTPQEYSALLQKHGFEIKFMDHFKRPTPLPKDLKAWLLTFRKSYLEELQPSDVPAFLEEIQEAVHPQLCDAQGHWTADYVRLRFQAFKK